MLETSISKSNTIKLKDLLKKLAAHAQVDAVLLIGSTGAGKMDKTSDIDLLIVLNEMPVPLFSVFTWIGGRMGDVYFISAAQVDEYLEKEDAFPVLGMGSRLVYWLHHTGLITYDNSRRLTRLREKTKRGDWVIINDDMVYRAWFSVNYNLRQNSRMINSTDPEDQAMLDLRLLYCTADLMTAYCAIRRIAWRGEKVMIQYWQKHDPAYWELFQKYLNAPDRSQRIAFYQELAAATLKPIGGVWNQEITAVLPTEDVNADLIKRGLTFWEELIGG